MKMNLKKVCAILLLLSLVLSVFPPLSISSEGAQVDLSDYRGLVISRVFGHGDKKDAVTAYSFFELYNSSENTLDLDGLALYYKTSGNDPYVSFEFGDQQNHVMAPGSYYLIRCNKKNSSAEVITLTHWDAIWDLSVSNKEIKLILAEEGRTIDPLAQPAEVENVLSYFCATADYYFDSGYLIDEISKSKYAVRTALREDSGWTDVNLTKQNSAGLRRIMPQYSGGDAGEIVASNYAEVTFSEDAGFFTEGFALSLTPPTGYTDVYYTLDGSDPRTSSSRVLYSAPLTLNDTSSMGPGATTLQVAQAMTLNQKDPRAPGDYLPLSNDYPGGYVVKAVAFDGENYTDVYTNTYFISDKFEDYGVSVMSISMDKNDVAGTSPTAFYNHYYTETNDSNPRSLGLIEVFDENGQRRGYSNIEIAINGHASANYAMKSMKLYFKKSLNQDAGENQIGGLENKLNYDLFNGGAKNCKGQAITTFSRLVLRNSGNDLYNSMMRDAYEQRASADLDVDTTASAPVLVFINGEFWGWYNARERYCEEYVEAHYGVDEANVAIIENDYTLVRTNRNAPLIVNDGDVGDADPFNDLVTFMKTNSMAVDANYRYVTDQLDIDSLIDMYIAHLYFNAVDWPENNIKIWRNKNAEDISGTDTKWHFTLHDTDFGAGFYDGYAATAVTPKSTAQSVNIFNAIDTTTCVIGNVMHALIQNQEFRNYFIAKCYSAFRELYTADRLTALLDEMAAVRTPLMELQIARWGRDYDHTLGRTINASSYELALNQMYTFVKSRQSIAMKQLLAYFNITEEQAMALAGYSVSDGTAVSPYSFINCSFDHFYINGVRMNTSDANNWIAANLTDRTVPKTYGGHVNSVGFYGWIGFYEPVEAVGYSINGGTPVLGSTGSVFYRVDPNSTDKPILLERHGGPNAVRFAVTVPTENLANLESVVAVVQVGGVIVPIDSNLINTGFISPDTTVIIDNTDGTPPVTPDPGEPEDPPSGEPVFVGASFDTLYRNGSPLNTGANAGNANNWITANLPNRTLYRSVCGQTATVGFSGWIGFDRDITAFGYVINGGQPVWNNSYKLSNTEDAVRLPQNGGAHAVRFNISNIPVDSTGITTVVAVANVGGTVVPIDAHLVNTNAALAIPDTTITVDNTVMPKTSYDQLKIDGVDVGSYGNNPNPSNLNLTGYTGKLLEIWGWHANATGISRFGFRVDGGEPVWSNGFMATSETTQDVINAGISAVGPGAHTSRFRIFAPIEEGRHVIEALCDTGNGVLSIWTIDYLNGPAEPQFKSHTLLLSGQIGVNFYMDLSMLTPAEREAAQMEFVVNGVSSYDTFDRDCTNPSTHKYYGFTCYINSLQMAETITAVLHYGDGLTVSQTYSAKQYVDYIVANSSAYTTEALDLVRSIADYGHYVQPFLEANHSFVLGQDYAVMPGQTVYTAADVTETRAAVADRQIVKNTGNSQIEAVTFSLDFESETTIRIYLKTFDGYNGNVTATVNGTAVDCVMQNDGRYRIEIGGIAAHKLGDVYEVSVSAGGTCTVSVSGLSYVYTMLNSTSSTFDNDTCHKAAVAIYRYYQKTIAYRGQQNG